MQVSAAGEIIELLRGIEQRSQAHAAGLPQQIEPPHSMEGVVFSLLDRRLIVPLNEVVELLPYPGAVTVVPGARSWVKGIANIRGTLLPLIDLQAFLGGSQITPDRRSRVLVIDHQDLVAGLLVESVIGLRHFLEENLRNDVRPEGVLEQYATAAYEQDGEVWPVFSTYVLAENPEFQVAAG